MARIVVRDGTLLLRLNPIERFFDLRLRSPRVPIRDVVSVNVTRPGRVIEEVDMGFAGNTAPLGALVMAKSRRNRHHGRPAAIFVYLRLKSIAVEFAPSASWGLWLVSSTEPERELAILRAAVEAR